MESVWISSLVRCRYEGFDCICNVFLCVFLMFFQSISIVRSTSKAEPPEARKFFNWLREQATAGSAIQGDIEPFLRSFARFVRLQGGVGRSGKAQAGRASLKMSQPQSRGTSFLWPLLRSQVQGGLEPAGRHVGHLSCETALKTSKIFKDLTWELAARESSSSSSSGGSVSGFVSVELQARVASYPLRR